MSTRIHPLMTVEDLETLPDDGNRYELLEGELITGESSMTRSPALAHQFALDSLFFRVRTYLEQNPVGVVITTPGVIFDKYNSVIPDLVFITKEQADRVGQETHLNEAPALVVEVVSPGVENARRDRVMKLQIYGKFGVGEYWIVDPEARAVEIYRPAGGPPVLAETLTKDGALTSPALPGFACPLEKIFGK